MKAAEAHVSTEGCGQRKKAQRRGRGGGANIGPQQGERKQSSAIKADFELCVVLHERHFKGTAAGAIIRLHLKLKELEMIGSLQRVHLSERLRPSRVFTHGGSSLHP